MLCIDLPLCSTLSWKKRFTATLYTLFVVAVVFLIVSVELAVFVFCFSCWTTHLIHLIMIDRALYILRKWSMVYKSIAFGLYSLTHSHTYTSKSNSKIEKMPSKYVLWDPTFLVRLKFIISKLLRKKSNNKKQNFCCSFYCSGIELSLIKTKLEKNISISNKSQWYTVTEKKWFSIYIISSFCCLCERN